MGKSSEHRLCETHIRTMQTITTLLLACLSCAGAFVLPVIPARTLTTKRLTMKPQVQMNAVNAAAENCLEEGCSLDTVSTLIDELDLEAEELQKRLNYVLFTMGKLEGLKGVPDNTDEVTKLVKAAMRIFSPTEDDFPATGEATAYTGTKNPNKGLRPNFPVWG